MFRIINEVRPRFVVGENVAGFVKMELDRTISNLEGIGYTVQPVIIPACAVQAVHRRDRVWIIAADSDSERLTEGRLERCGERGIGVLPNEQNRDSLGRNGEGCSGKRVNTHANSKRWEECGLAEFAKEQGFSERLCPEKPSTNPISGRLQSRDFSSIETEKTAKYSEKHHEHPRHHLKISESPVSGKHDGLPGGMDSDRAKRIKALGNAIVPQVAYEIFKAMKETL